MVQDAIAKNTRYFNCDWYLLSSLPSLKIAVIDESSAFVQINFIVDSDRSISIPRPRIDSTSTGVIPSFNLS